MHSETLPLSPSDEELMERFCQGDEQAFDVLFTRYAKPIFNYTQAMVRDRALAEDLVQLTFLSAVRSRGRFDPSYKVASWLYAIASNAARDALRRRRSRREEELTPTSTEQSGQNSSQDTLGDPGLRRAIEQALAQLSTIQREAVLLHRFHGLSFEETAAALGTTVGAARVRAHRGSQRLQELLGGLYQGIP